MRWVGHVAFIEAKVNAQFGWEHVKEKDHSKTEVHIKSGWKGCECSNETSGSRKCREFCN
jgi:hypothetical protein